MQTTLVNATDAPVPAGNYSQAVLIEAPSRWLCISGQIPEDTEGMVPEGFEAQCRLVWRNIAAQLAAADMSLDNLVKVTTFLSHPTFRSANTRIRNELLGERKPALTIIICDIYASKWLLEIEAMAAA